MPQTTIKPYQPSKRTEEFVFREGDEDEAPLVMTIRASLTHGEIDPLRQWFHSLAPDPDEEPEDDDDSAASRKRARQLVKERWARAENTVAWPLIAPFVLGWNVVDGDGEPIPPPAEYGPEAFGFVPNRAFGDVLLHLLGIPQRRVEAARKASGASGATDAPSPDSSSPVTPETIPSP